MRQHNLKILLSVDCLRLFEVDYQPRHRWGIMHTPVREQDPPDSEYSI